MRHFIRATSWFGGLFLVTWPVAEAVKHGAYPASSAALAAGAVAVVIWAISSIENWD